MPSATIDSLPPDYRDIFHKGMGAMERGNLDYAMDMFFACIEKEPLLIDVRKFLRAAELKQAREKKPGFLTHAASTISNLPVLTQATVGLKAGNFRSAILACETLLRKDPLNMRFVRLFCKAVEAAGAPDLAVQTLSMIREHYPKDASLLMWLGRLYLEANRPAEARECFETVVQARPNDGTALKAMKDAMALQSLTREAWGAVSETGSFRAAVKDVKEAEILEKEAKAVRSVSDTMALIQQTLEKIEREPDNVNYYRHLSNLYATARMFDDAARVLQQAQTLRSGADPEIAAAITALRLKNYDAGIAELAAAGDQSAADELTAERNEFYFQDIKERVAKYPNDLNLRYEMGVACMERDLFTEAIQQFQLSNRSPHWRVKSLYFMGICFEAKGQYDMAERQIKEAAAEQEEMDDTKKDILYELGRIREAVNDREGAEAYYKQIYQVDISYKDVATKVEGSYGK